MGGVHASMVASLFPGPVACTPLLAPRSASVAFCSGALWDATAWKPLLSPEDQSQRVAPFPPPRVLLAILPSLSEERADCELQVQKLGLAPGIVRQILVDSTLGWRGSL